MILIGQTIAEMLPFAAVVALSPIPIVAVIVMLLTDRARAKSAAYAAGWAVGLAAIGAIAAWTSSGSDSVGGHGYDEHADLVRVGLGVLLALFALRKWRSRPAPDAEPELPKWLTAVDDFTVLKSLGFGIALAILNPKSLAMAIAAGLAIAEQGLPEGESAIALAVFVLLGSATVILPVLLFIVAGKRAEPLLAQSQTWLIDHNSAVVAITLAVIAAVLIVQGLFG